MGPDSFIYSDNGSFFFFNFSLKLPGISLCLLERPWL